MKTLYELGEEYQKTVKNLNTQINSVESMNISESTRKKLLGVLYAQRAEARKISEHLVNYYKAPEPTEEQQYILKLAGAIECTIPVFRLTIKNGVVIAKIESRNCGITALIKTKRGLVPLIDVNTLSDDEWKRISKRGVENGDK